MAGWRGDGSHRRRSPASPRPRQQRLWRPQLAVWRPRGRRAGTSAVRCSRSCGRRKTQCRRGEQPSQLIMDLCVPDPCPGPGPGWRQSPRILPSRATSMNTPRRHFRSGDFEVFSLKAVYSSAFSTPALPFIYSEVRPQAERSRGRAGSARAAQGSCQGRARQRPRRGVHAAGGPGHAGPGVQASGITT